jgi:hypothetical protein
MAIAEYTILAGFAVAGLAWVLGRHPGTVPVTRGWFSLGGIGGKGDLAAGLVASVYIFSGWDGTFYDNEEVRQRRVNSGRPPCSRPASSPCCTPCRRWACKGWCPRPGCRPTPPTRWSTWPARWAAGRGQAAPVPASLVVGAVITGPTIVYLLATSLQSAFNDVVNLSGQMFAVFYILTALAAVTYYRRRILGNAWDALVAGVLPLGGAAFLGWILSRYLQTAPAPQLWSFAGILGTGLIMMLIARFALHSPFFQIPRESASREP